jgi:hypothetical protein
MDITIITPTTNHPLLKYAIKSVKDAGLESQHLIVSDGAGPVEVFTPRTLELPENTGRDPETGKVKWFGHRIYSAMSFLVNTKWIYFLDEDNRIAENFWTVLSPVLDKLPPNSPALTFRRKVYHNNTNELIGYDDSESVPENMFCDTGCIIWNTRYFAEHIAHTGIIQARQDWASYAVLVAKHMAGSCQIHHVKEYLLEYNASKQNEEYFKKICRKQL